jgi:hypothetical protein
MTAIVRQPSPVVDDATVAEFAATGSVIVRGLFSPDEVATIERGIERSLADPSPCFKVASSDNDPGSFDGLDNCSMWAPVDPVPEESTLEFLSGSHRQGWLMPRSFMTNEAKWFPEGSLTDLPDVEAERTAYDIRSWAMQPGDAVFFHMLTLHHSYGVPGTSRRRAFSLRFLGDDMVHAPRRWVTSPQFDGLEAELPAGSALDHELFPVLRDID